MERKEPKPIWGVVGLNKAEQRKVRGGRGSCLRNAYRNFRSNLRCTSRESARSQLLNDIQFCSFYGSSH